MPYRKQIKSNKAMTIEQLLVELKESFPLDAEVKSYKVKAKLEQSTRTLEGPCGVFQIEVKSDQQPAASGE